MRTEALEERLDPRERQLAASICTLLLVKQVNCKAREREQKSDGHCDRLASCQYICTLVSICTRKASKLSNKY